MLAAVIALALLAVLMAGRSAINAVRAGRLRRQQKELHADVGALQRALLPAVPDRIGDVDLSVAWRPADGPAAGGDFHDIFPLRDGRVGVIVGDVSGHGREALAPTALVHYTVRAHLEAGLAPRTVMRLTDEVIGGKLDGNFATVIAGIVDPVDSTLTFATAGHPVPLMVGRERDHAIASLTPAPIGIGPISGGRQTRLSIGRDSGVCFFTDGLIEARAENGLLGREGLAEALEALAGRQDANELLDHLAEQTASGGDDMTACLVRPVCASGDGKIVEELEIGWAVQHPEDLSTFLTDFGLAPDEADLAVEASRAWSGRGTPAVLRVEQGQSGTHWEISPGLESPRLGSSESSNLSSMIARGAPALKDAAPAERA